MILLKPQTIMASVVIDNHPWDTGNGGVTYTVTHNKGKVVRSLNVITDHITGDKLQPIVGLDGRLISGFTRFNGYTSVNKTNLNQIDITFYRMSGLSVGGGKIYVDLLG